MNWLSQMIDNAASWFVVTILGGALWLVRRILTNQRQIEALQAEIKARAETAEAVEATRQAYREKEMTAVTTRLDRIDAKLDVITFRRD